jgi:hypothetical protein
MTEESEWGRDAAFNYSAAQWEEIESLVRDVHPGGMSKRVRERLVGEARWFLLEKYYLKRGAEQRAWQKIARQFEKLERAIANVAGQHIELIKRAGYSKRGVLKLTRYYAREFTDGLSEMKGLAEDYADLNKKAVEAAHYDNPKMMYEFKILLLWTELGGALRLSRHSKLGNIRGPLARFFRAVTVPVMGDSAPSLESLPDILKRQKKFLAFESSATTAQRERFLDREFSSREVHRGRL